MGLQIFLDNKFGFIIRFRDDWRAAIKAILVFDILQNVFVFWLVSVEFIRAFIGISVLFFHL